VPLGKGQCDIRLQVDNQVEVSVRGDMVFIHTLAGQEPRDDGSECNLPLPNREVMNFNFEVLDSRNDIRLMAPPSPRNNYAAIVHIRDNSGGFGRYHFRLSWAITGGDYRPGRGNMDVPPPGRRDDDFDRPPAGRGFAWNNTINFRGVGRGEAWLNDFGPTRLGQVNIDIDRGGRIVAVFRADRGRDYVYNGSVVAREGNRWKAEVTSQDRRLRGIMFFEVDGRGNVFSVDMNASDGRDRLRLNWDRR